MEGGLDPFVAGAENQDDIINLRPSMPIDCTELVETLRGEIEKKTQEQQKLVVETLKGEIEKKTQEQQNQIDKLVSSVDLLVNKFISQRDNSRPNAYEAPPTNTPIGNINNIAVGNVAYRLTWYPFKDPTFGFDQL